MHFAHRVEGQGHGRERARPPAKFFFVGAVANEAEIGGLMGMFGQPGMGLVTGFGENQSRNLAALKYLAVEMALVEFGRHGMSSAEGRPVSGLLAGDADMAPGGPRPH